MIRELETESDFEQFMQFAPEVYKNNRNWVPADPEHVHSLIRDGGPFAFHSRVQSFLAEGNGGVVARVTAVVDDAFNDYWKDAVGHLFFFEALPDHDEEVRELLHHACAWLAAQRSRTARLAFHYAWQLPLTIDAYDVRPTVFHTYNPPYYHAYLKDGGFKTERGLVEYRVQFTQELSERYRQMVERSKNEGARLRPWNFDRMEEENDRFAEQYRATFNEHWSVPMLTNEECGGLTVHMKEVLVPEFTVFADIENRPAGFVYSLPDLNNPEAKHALLLAIGVLKEFRGRGLNLAMAAQSYLGMIEAGYRSASFTIVLDDNRPSRRTAEKLGCRAERNFVCYSRDLK